jgi:diguanylate cyclase (GGDEF)-like protein
LVVVLFSVVNSAVTSRDRQIAGQDDRLRVALGEQIDAVQSYFERARTIDALLAASPVFADFYRAPGTNRQKINTGGPLMNRVTAALGELETMFPGRIGEACFIDGSGAEIARVVDGTPATPAQLSSHEDENPFFAPTIAAGTGVVYQAKMYESPDTHNPVISNSTVVTAAGHTGMVHFEIALSSFRMPESASGTAASVVDAGTGRLIVDSRTTVTASGPGDLTLRPLVRAAHRSGVTTLDGRRVAYQKVAASAGNANSWYVAVSEPAFGRGWSRGLGVGSLALILGALLTVMVAVAGGWSHLRSLNRAALYDSLTGLPTRTLLNERLRDAVRGGRPTTVLSVDLQRFQEVNDVLGYRHGDLLLQQVAARLAAAAPAAATVARLGGDDFAVLLAGSGHDGAGQAAEALLSALHRSFVVEGISLDIEATVGAAVFPDHGGDGEQLLRHADAAMHLAKDHNSGFEVYEPQLEDHTPSRLALLGDLRRALESDDQIVVHYQPKVDLTDGHLTGVEALVRWEHPHRGRVAPDQFIPVAETTSLIRPLTSRVLDIAVRQAARWQHEGLHIPVAVNLSTRCLLDPELPSQVFDLLHRNGVDPSLLELEITETMMMVDPERATAILHRLRDGGIGLSIDDFGTGHSSMAYLQQLPVTELKIDRSFVQQLAADHRDVLVRTAIGLGHNLGLRVVAEGVENDETAAALRDLGCDIAQGYHFARPMPAADIRRWLESTDADGLTGVLRRPVGAAGTPYIAKTA